VEQFADKPAQFVWITEEEESSVAPWLVEHSIKGWVFSDPDGAIARSYGLELPFPAAVIIGKDGRIIGFDSSIVPTASTVDAALEGRITTTSPERGLAAAKAFDESRMVLLDPEPPRMPLPENHKKPDFTPSYTVHISPSQGDAQNSSGRDGFKSFQGFALKNLIAQLYGATRPRIVLPPALDDGKRYDIAIVLPEPESDEVTNNRIRQGIEDYFHVAVTREERLVDVYVVTAIDGKSPKTKIDRSEDQHSGGSWGSSVGFAVARGAGEPDDLAQLMKPVSISEIRSIYMEGTLDDFCRTLEYMLDRPVVNETKIEGAFALNIKASEGADNDFLERLRDELNLSITPAQRSVQMVVLKPR
jgi:uncharacterized protein (TIGR03435 family)